MTSYTVEYRAKRNEAQIKDRIHRELGNELAKLIYNRTKLPIPIADSRDDTLTYSITEIYCSSVEGAEIDRQLRELKAYKSLFGDAQDLVDRTLKEEVKEFLSCNTV